MPDMISQGEGSNFRELQELPRLMLSVAVPASV